MLVMFVCQANVGRSQVAEAYFERLSGHEVVQQRAARGRGDG